MIERGTFSWHRSHHQVHPNQFHPLVQVAQLVMKGALRPPGRNVRQVVLLK
jgi:hypothetical protein